ncbi:MAG: LysR substrate-binding domain-containing protein [Xanthobacteraceae bacterium]
MKLHQLRDITAIAEHGSLRAAARSLRLAQPALTRSVHDLEHELGAALFERRSRGMTPTAVGAAFLKRARAIMNDIQRAREEAEQIGVAGAAHGTVVAGLSGAAHVAMLPRALTRFRARYPDVQLRMIEGLYPTLESGLKDGSVDFYIGPKPERAASKELMVEKLFDNTRAIMARIGHPLANATSLDELAEAEWVTTSITHRATEELGAVFARKRLPPPRLVIQTQSALSVIMAVAYSDALCMLPIQFAEFELTKKALVQIRVDESLPASPIVLVRRAGLLLTPAAECFVDLLRGR